MKEEVKTMTAKVEKEQQLRLEAEMSTVSGQIKSLEDSQ